MTGISSNAKKVAEIFADRSKQWDAALAKAMRKAITTVQVHAIGLLSGSGAPGDYPIPTGRTKYSRNSKSGKRYAVTGGHLRQSQGMKITSQTSGIVYNDAGYAHAIHSGRIAVGYKGSGRKQVRPRPFLEDAMKNAEPGRIVQQMMSAAL